jgi:hypothetical protein
MIGDQKGQGVGCINLLVRKQIHSGRARSDYGAKRTFNPSSDFTQYCPLSFLEALNEWGWSNF